MHDGGFGRHACGRRVEIAEHRLLRQYQMLDDVERRPCVIGGSHALRCLRQHSNLGNDGGALRVYVVEERVDIHAGASGGVILGVSAA